MEKFGEVGRIGDACYYNEKKETLIRKSVRAIINVNTRSL